MTDATARKRRLDVDALLQETAFEFVFGGETLLLTDIPVGAAIAAQNRGEKGESDPDAEMQFVKDVLGPCCADEAQRQRLFDYLGKLGIRGRHAVTLSLMDFFEPSDLIEKLPLGNRLRAALTGLAQWESTSSATTSPETTPG